MGPVLGFVAVVLGLFGLFRLLERTQPVHRRLPVMRKGFRTDLTYLAFQPSLGNAIAEFFAFVALLPLVLLIYGRVDQSTILAGHGPLSTLPYWAQAALIIVVADFAQYWMHRAMHHGKRLWRFHAVHHSSTDLDWLSGVRGHPVNEVLNRVAILAPILMLGVAPAAFIAVAPISTLFALLQHANLDWDFGPLRKVIASPRFHRWHHSAEPDAQGKNFAGFLPLWDILFGTYYMPEGKLPERFGTSTPVPDGLWAQLTFPFRGEKRGGAG